MSASPQRILTTHVGSLIRPDDLLAFLHKQQNGEPYDKAAYEECLKRSVADVVRKQAEVGIDIVSDGEYGKTISWSRYILDRISGFEERHDTTPGFRSAVAGKDRRDFAAFYEEYEATYGFVGMGKAFKTGTWVVTGPIKYTGQAAIQRDIEDLKKAIAGLPVANAFLPVVAPASVVPQRKDEYYKSRGRGVVRDRRGVTRGIQGDRRCRPDRADRRRVPRQHLRRDGAAEDARRITANGRKSASRRSITLCREFPRNVPAITSAGEAGTGPTPTMLR